MTPSAFDGKVIAFLRAAALGASLRRLPSSLRRSIFDVEASEVGISIHIDPFSDYWHLS